jgi:hypothetical protein
MRDENFDGIDDYNNQQLMNSLDNNSNNDNPYVVLDRAEALQKFTEESEDIFDDAFLDDDLAAFNLGYQAGSMDERERIIKLIKGDGK